MRGKPKLARLAGVGFGDTHAHVPPSCPWAVGVMAKAGAWASSGGIQASHSDLATQHAYVWSLSFFTYNGVSHSMASRAVTGTH